VRHVINNVDAFATSVAVDDERGGENSALKVFAGCRADPSFIDANRSKEGNRPRDVDMLTSAPFLPVLHGNVLSIVIDLDLDPVIRTHIASSMLAVEAETGTEKRSIDRMGRILMTSFLIGEQKSVFATTDVDPIKDAWNSDDVFALNPQYLPRYRSSLEAGLKVIDGLDGHELDWNFTPQHSFLDVLLGDFLLVDTSKPLSNAESNGPTYMEIEMSYVRGEQHRTCGGRTPNDDVVDTWLTWFINGPSRSQPKRGDGVDSPAIPAGNMFPFLVPPHGSEVTDK
jgi:hypothetical protein